MHLILSRLWTHEQSRDNMPQSPASMPLGCLWVFLLFWHQHRYYSWVWEAFCWNISAEQRSWHEQNDRSVIAWHAHLFLSVTSSCNAAPSQYLLLSVYVHGNCCLLYIKAAAPHVSVSTGHGGRDSAAFLSLRVNVLVSFEQSCLLWFLFSLRVPQAVINT